MYNNLPDIQKSLGKKKMYACIIRYRNKVYNTIDLMELPKRSFARSSSFIA